MQSAFLELAGRHQLREPLDRAHVLASTLGPLTPISEKVRYAFAMGLAQNAALFDPLA
jgi:hypothetical protein